MGKLCNEIFSRDVLRLKNNLYRLRVEETAKVVDGIIKPYSQKDLAAALSECAERETSFHMRTIQNAEDVLCDVVPSLELLKAYCDFFDVSLASLFGSEDIVTCCLDDLAISNQIGISCNAVKVLRHHAARGNVLTSRVLDDGSTRHFLKNDVVEVVDWLIRDRDALRALVELKQKNEELNERKNNSGLSKQDFEVMKRGAISAACEKLFNAFSNYDFSAYAAAHEITQKEFNNLQAIKRGGKCSIARTY